MNNRTEKIKKNATSPFAIVILVAILLVVGMLSVFSKIDRHHSLTKCHPHSNSLKCIRKIDTNVKTMPAIYTATARKNQTDTII